MGKLLLVLLIGLPILGQRPKFEVASFKLAAGDGASEMAKTPGRVDFANLPLVYIIQQAYRIDPNQLTGPDWMRTARFDLHARVPDGATVEQVPEMLQSLLAERLRMTVHHQSQDESLYVLTVAKDGAMLTPAAEQTEESKRTPLAGEGTRRVLMTIARLAGGYNTVSNLDGKRTVFEGRNISMADLVRILRVYSDAAVVDKTALAGAYDVVLDLPKKRPGARPQADGAADQASEPDVSLFESVKKLGLRLEKQKLPVDHIVIDHIEKVPVEN